MADGTDFEALPFIRIDRTEPNVTKVDIPPLLLTVDSYPHTHRKPPVVEEGEDPEEVAEERANDRDWLVRFLYPFGRYLNQGGRSSLTLTAFLTANSGLSASGPAGRAVSPNEEVRANPFPIITGNTGDEGLRLLPFVFSAISYDHNDLADTDGTDLDNDVSLSPFFMAGWGDEDDEDYFAVFPFGGVTKGLLGKEKITWYGFPYPFYAKVKDRSYDSHHILFPFINWIDGPRNSGFRIMPFYGHYERRGLRGNPIYERTFIMWPFFTHSRSGLNEPRPTDVWFLFPFYGRLDSPDRQQWTFLWPFFKYTEDKEYTSRGTLKGIRWNLRAPFPFLEIGGGPDRWQFDLWPLFGIKRRAGFKREFVLWPIYRHEQLSEKKTWFEGIWIIPIFWRTYWEETDTGRIRHKWHGYPIIHWRRQYTGERTLETLSPWFYEDEGWDRTFAPFLRLYKYHRDRDGGVEHQFLFGLFSYRNLPAVPERNKKSYFRLSFLFGLFQYRNLGGERGLRFLWLPEFPTWGGDAVRSEP